MSETPTVSLANLMTPSKTVTLDFPGAADMTVDVCHLSREELVKLRKKCVKTKFNRSTHKPEDELDEDTFIVLYCKAVIKGWSGLKYKYLEELLLVDIADYDPDDTLPYSESNAELLMKNSTDFDTWITEVVGDLGNFTKAK